MSPTVRQPSGLVVCEFLSGSLRYSKSATPSAQTTPVSPEGSSLPLSSRMCRVPSSDLPTDPGRASHSCGVMKVNPAPSEDDQYSWMIGPHHAIIASFTSTGQG